MSQTEATPTPIDLTADWPGALLIATGITCLLQMLTVVGRAFFTGWELSPLLPLVFFIVALLAFYRHRWIRLYRPYGSRLSIYVAELVILVLLTRLVPLLATPNRLLALLPTWWADPGTFFDAGFVIDAFLVGFGWFLGHSLAAAVDQLHLQPGELPPPRGTPEYENWERSEAAFDHRGSYRHITNHVLGGGVLIIIALTIAAGLGSAGSGLLREAFIATGLYFVAGLLLIGWAHVSLLDTLWRIDGLSTPSLLTRQWPGWVALLLLTVAVLALVAPRSYAVDPIALFTWVLQAIITVAQIVIFLLMLPFLWLASLFSGDGGSPPAASPAMPIMPAVTRSDGEFPFLATLRSLGFWAVTLALAVYSLRTLYQSRWGALRLLPGFAPWAMLVRLWQSLLRGLRTGAVTLASVLRPGSAARAALGAVLNRPARRPRPTDPRGLVQFLYLSLIERAGRRGYPRRRGMTATEYSHHLAARLAAVEASASPGAPDPATARADLDALTAAFLEARYSQHPVDDSAVSRARRALQRLLALIRRPASPR